MPAKPHHKPQNPPYAILRLRRDTLAAWAVICLSSGAIALDGENRLLMGLTEDDATRVAAVMTDGVLEPKPRDR